MVIGYWLLTKYEPLRYENDNDNDNENCIKLTFNFQLSIFN